VVELSQHVAARAEQLERRAPRWAGRVGYHDSCHMLRELRLAAEPRAVLATVAGLELVPLPSADRCCGFGGTFSVRLPDVSVAMADTKLVEAEQAGVDALVTADPGCLLQLGGRLGRTGSRVRPLHLATLLAEALA
jgi:L-lactate dehydrogenase complex protein LldE